MKLMRSKDYQIAMNMMKNNIIMVIDSMLNSILAEDEIVSKEFKNKKEKEISSLMIEAIRKDINIVGIDKKSLETIEDKMKTELNVWNKTAISAIKGKLDMANKLNVSENSINQAITEEKASASKQLNSTNGIERDNENVKEKLKAQKKETKQASQTIKPIKTKEQVIEELGKVYKPNESIGK